MKIGKTQLACSIPEALIMATEKGQNAIPGIYVQDIKTWSDAQMVVRQLKTPQAKEKFKTIVIDTFSILSDLCEKYVCDTNNVQTLAAVPWGGGWSQYKKELRNLIRDITMEGYGLVLLAHCKVGEETTDDGVVHKTYDIDLSKAAMNIANAAVDVIGMCMENWNEKGESERVIVTRRTPYIQAGSRFPKMKPVFPLSYEALVDAFVEAIEAQGEDGAELIDEAPVIETEDLYGEKMAEAKALYSELVKPEQDNAINEKNVNAILDIIEKYLHERKKLSLIKEREAEALALIVEDMKELVKE